MTKYFFRKTWGRDQTLEVKGRFFGRENLVFEETMKVRGSMYEYFAPGGSARAAV